MEYMPTISIVAHLVVLFYCMYRWKVLQKKAMATPGISKPFLAGGQYEMGIVLAIDMVQIRLAQICWVLIAIATILSYKL